MIAAVVLAAGRAARLGLPKPLLPAGPGETLLTRALRVGLEAVEGPVVAVIGAEADLMQADMDGWARRAGVPADRVRSILNPRYAEGMSTSLRAGVAAAAGAEGVLVLRADQPGVDVTRVSDLVRRFRSRSAPIVAVAASWDGEQRTPVVLGSELFGEVAGLVGDEGARRLLRRRPDEVVHVGWGDGPWRTDVDTWDDYVAVAGREGWDREAPAPADGPLPAGRDIGAWAAVLQGRGTAEERLDRFRRLVLEAVKR